MPAAKGTIPPAAGKGRVKGSVNKVTATAKAAIMLAGEKLGGGERLFQWTQEDPDNEKAFWVTIYPKLLPLQVNGSGEDGEFIHKITREFVHAAKPEDTDGSGL